MIWFNYNFKIWEISCPSSQRLKVFFESKRSCAFQMVQDFNHLQYVFCRCPIQHPSILHQALPFHHHILKPFQMVPQIDCHLGRLLTWTTSKRWKNPSVTWRVGFRPSQPACFLKSSFFEMLRDTSSIDWYQGITAYPFSHKNCFSERQTCFSSLLDQQGHSEKFSVSTKGSPDSSSTSMAFPQSKTTRITPCVLECVRIVQI